MGDNWKRRMDSYFDSMENEHSTNKEITIEQVAEYTAKCFHDKWFASYDYNLDNIKHFNTVPLREEVRKNLDFRKSVAYIMSLYDCLMNGESYGYDKWVIDEVEEWEIKGGNCLYFSVLLYNLLMVDTVGCPECIKYVQGFYRHNVRADYPSFLPWSGQHNGLHAWVSIDGSIVDIAIKQQEMFFDFKDEPFVIAKIPDGLTYMGWEESQETVFRYTKEICEFSKKPFALWIAEHNLNALKLYKQSLEGYKKRLEDKYGV